MKKIFLALFVFVIFGTSANNISPCTSCEAQQTSIDTASIIHSVVADIVEKKVDSVQRIVDSLSNARLAVLRQIDSLKDCREIRIESELIRYRNGWYLYQWHFKGKNFFKLKISKF